VSEDKKSGIENVKGEVEENRTAERGWGLPAETAGPPIPLSDCERGGEYFCLEGSRMQARFFAIGNEEGNNEKRAGVYAD
jgi:hypothetical protein